MAKPSDIPKLNIPIEALQFLAGYFEGEGSIFVTSPSGKRQHQLALAVQSGDKLVLERFSAIFGGDVHLAANKKDSRRQVYAWRKSGFQAQIVLKALLPYLVTKLPVAIIGLQLTFPPRGGYMVDRTVPLEELELRDWAARCCSMYNNRNTLLHVA